MLVSSVVMVEGPEMMGEPIWSGSKGGSGAGLKLLLILLLGILLLRLAAVVVAIMGVLVLTWAKAETAKPAMVYKRTLDIFG